MARDINRKHGKDIRQPATETDPLLVELKPYFLLMKKNIVRKTS